MSRGSAHPWEMEAGTKDNKSARNARALGTQALGFDLGKERMAGSELQLVFRPSKGVTTHPCR
jgi:hypothetical protein